MFEIICHGGIKAIIRREANNFRNKLKKFRNLILENGEKLFFKRNVLRRNLLGMRKVNSKTTFALREVL